MSAPDIQYQQRIIAFLDSLGFKDQIEHSVADPQHVTRIAGALPVK